MTNGPVIDGQLALAYRIVPEPISAGEVGGNTSTRLCHKPSVIPVASSIPPKSDIPLFPMAALGLMTVLPTILSGVDVVTPGKAAVICANGI